MFWRRGHKELSKFFPRSSWSLLICYWLLLLLKSNRMKLHKHALPWKSTKQWIFQHYGILFVSLCILRSKFSSCRPQALAGSVVNDHYKNLKLKAWYNALILSHKEWHKKYSYCYGTVTSVVTRYKVTPISHQPIVAQMWHYLSIKFQSE